MSLDSVFLFSQNLKISGLFIDLILAILSLMSAGGYFCFNRNSLTSSSLLINVFFFPKLSVLVNEVSVVNAHLNDYLLSFLFVSMKAKTNFLRCIGYLSFTKDHTKQDLLQILALVLLLNFLNY